MSDKFVSIHSRRSIELERDLCKVMADAASEKLKDANNKIELLLDAGWCYAQAQSAVGGQAPCGICAWCEAVKKVKEG